MGPIYKYLDAPLIPGGKVPRWGWLILFLPSLLMVVVQVATLFIPSNLMPNPARLGYALQGAAYMGSMDCPDQKTAHLAQMQVWADERRETYWVLWTFDGKVLAAVYVNPKAGTYKTYVDPGFTGRYTATDEGKSPSDKSASDYYKMIPACKGGKFWFTGGNHEFSG